ncbi:hypothetical protein PYCCODRAFT_780059 [Trametes coccinea BRFM310]|uniref:DUF6697 domain-containing protein n=1 Tax=Trametes coccinea (strain BRFM310) TaxID=1353009 RepID=A0A1Y2J294_TRAC3|nr:hypothetical protein PYCCODRAFT_780059 [Trametes coccinea BRFM310]
MGDVDDAAVVDRDASTQIVKRETADGPAPSADGLFDLAEEVGANWRSAPYPQPWLEVDTSGETATLQAYMDARLHGIPVFPVNLDPSMMDVSVSRKFMGDHFGGSKRAMVVSYSDDNRRDHGHRYANCLYLKDLINWGIPRRPGGPGVLFIVESSLWSAGPQKVFIWLDHSKWLYVGEYELTRAGFLSPQEFKLLPHKMHL